MMDPKQGPTINWADILRGAANQQGRGPAGSGGNGDGNGPGNGGFSWGPPPGGQRPGSGQFKERLSEMGKKALITTLIVVIIAALIGYWWFHPVINIQSTDFWFILIIIIIVLAAVFLSMKQIYATGMGKREKSPKKEKLFGKLMYIPIAIALVGAIGWVTSLSLFPGNAEKYSSVLHTEQGDFAKDVPQVDYSSIPFIDRDSAVLLGNRAMGTMADYVSQFEISNLYSQINYKDTPVRVSPLNYADLFKWWANQDKGIPAYVIVNMTTQDTQVVRPENPIRYSDSDPFFKNVDRHVQLTHPFYMFDEKSFEIDDNGTPWWVYPVQAKTIGLFGGTTIQKVVLCNASTGEFEEYDIKDVPQWVDRAFPAELLIQQYNWSGALSGGWINSWLGQNGVKQTTPGSGGKLGYNYIAQNDDVWVYSGVTSATADNSIIGFVLINQRTAESNFFAVAGATEDSAMSSAEGQVQHLKYKATFPLLLNIENQPTYFMALKDEAGLVKMFAMVDIQRYQNVAVGDTLSATEKTYKNLLRQNGISTSSGSEETGVKAGSTSGSIVSMTPVVLDGNTHFYIIVDGNNAIFDCPVSSFPDIVRYKEGDRITLNHGSGGNLIAVDSIG